MRPLTVLTFVISLALASPTLAQDDWSLTRPRPTSKKRPANRSARARTTVGPAGDAAVDRREILIGRYTESLLADPFQTSSFQRLLDLYRERDGTIEALPRLLKQRMQQQGESYAQQALLGHAYRALDRGPEARAAYRRAAELRPLAPEPLVCLARIEIQSSNPTAALALLDQALERSRHSRQRRELVQQLGLLALDAGDLQAAARFHGELARLSGGGVQAATAYARALSERGHHAAAAEQYRAVLNEARGDPRTVAPILLDLGLAELEAGQVDGAVETLSLARKRARPDSGILWEIEEALLRACRSSGRLEQLAQSLKRGGKRSIPGSFRLLGRALDELGEIEGAADAYRRALRRRPRELETRERLIRLLSRDGDLEGALREHREMVRIAPREPRYLVRLAKLLSDTGQRAQALQLLARAGRRFARDPRIQEALYQLYTRWEEHELALRQLEALSRIEPEQTAHLVILGEQLMTLGRREAALAAWRRIPRAAQERARGHATLGGLFLDHGLELEALAEFREAVRLRGDDIAFVRGLGEVLERLNLTEEAVAQWRRVLELAGTDRNVRRQARRRLVSIWARSGRLQRQLAEFEARFVRYARADRNAGAPSGGKAADPVGGRTRAHPAQNDELRAVLQAGRFMAEAYLYLAGRRPGSSSGYRRQAESALQRVVALDPTDVESLLGLERLRTARGDEKGALEILHLLARADPANARNYFSRMAQSALTLYRDDEAERYAERAVQLDRDNAEAQKHLGDLHRARQDMRAAIAGYRRAIELDPRAFPTYLKLAEVHLSLGESEPADRLLLEVIRSCPDDDLVARAARSSLQIRLGEGSAEQLESVLLAATLTTPQRPVLRRLLVEVYGALVDGLQRRMQAGGSEANEAKQELGAVARRALRPLLDALWDREPEQRSGAIRLLGELSNPNAAGPLLAFAERDGEVGTRRRALIAAGRSADERHVSRFAALARGEEGLLAGAAAWALCRLGGPEARQTMRELLRSQTPEARAYAALGLGLARDSASLLRIQRLVREDPDRNVRLHALLGLGYLGEVASVPLVIEALHGGRKQIAAAAAIALAEIGDRTGLEALAEALFSPDRETSRAAAVGLGLAADPGRNRDLQERPLPPPGDFPGLGRTLAALAPPSDAEAITGKPIDRFADLIARAGSSALQGPPESIRAALRVLSLAGRGRRGQHEARQVERDDPSLVARLLPELLDASRHPDAAIRAAVLSLLATIEDERTLPVFLAGLHDGEEQVLRTALDLLRTAPADEARREALSGEVSALAARHRSWSIRARAVEVLGRLGGQDSERAVVAALGDGYAYVRSAAAGALGSIGSPAAVQALASSLTEDQEGRVRAAAAEALAKIGSIEAAAALERAAADPHPAVREALRRVRSSPAN